MGAIANGYLKKSQRLVRRMVDASLSAFWIAVDFTGVASVRGRAYPDCIIARSITFCTIGMDAFGEIAAPPGRLSS